MQSFNGDKAVHRNEEPKMVIVEEIGNGRVKMKCLNPYCGVTFETFVTDSRYWCQVCCSWVNAGAVNKVWKEKQQK